MFGWTDLSHSLTAEAAANTMVLFIKRSALFSLASREERVARFLLAATMKELRRTQEHALLISKTAKCRVTRFLIDLWERSGKIKYLDLPMSHQDIADHLGLTIETISRTLTGMERSGLISRVTPRTLMLQKHSLLRGLVS